MFTFCVLKSLSNGSPDLLSIWAQHYTHTNTRTQVQNLSKRLSIARRAKPDPQLQVKSKTSETGKKSAKIPTSSSVRDPFSAHPFFKITVFDTARERNNATRTTDYIPGKWSSEGSLLQSHQIGSTPIFPAFIQHNTGLSTKAQRIVKNLRPPHTFTNFAADD